MRGGEARLSVKVVGNLQIFRADGSEVRLTERRAAALIAILARSDSHRRSRDWIKATLWPRSPEPQCSNSLRQSLHTLRRALGDDADALGANRSHVWLERVSVEAKKPGEGAGFYEDAPSLDEPFEDWLREQRASATAAGPAGTPPANKEQPLLGMAPPIVVGDGIAAHSVANMLCDQIVDCLRFHEVIDVFDLRDLATDQLSRFGHGMRPSIELLARLRVVELGSSTQISIQVRDAETHRVVWSMALHGDDEPGSTLNIMRMMEFSAQVVEAIHAAVGRIAEPSREGVMQAAVHQLISHSVEGQHRARRILTETQSSSGLAHAWMAYTYAVAHGERHGVLGTRELEEAEFLCRRAAELDPSNALARALIAHVNAFVLQDYAMAADHLAVARRCGPNLAMTWRSAALHAHYTGNANRAREYAERAHRLGQFSPYQGVYSTCHMIASATTGRLRDAITIGEQILKKRPGYLAAMRHLSACYALEGHPAKARGLVESVRAIDPSFNSKGIRDPSYPLPSGRSIDLITEGFSALGMTN